MQQACSTWVCAQARPGCKPNRGGIAFMPLLCWCAEGPGEGGRLLNQDRQQEAPPCTVAGWDSMLARQQIPLQRSCANHHIAHKCSSKHRQNAAALLLLLLGMQCKHCLCSRPLKTASRGKPPSRPDALR